MILYSHVIDASGREKSFGNPDALFPYWSFTKTAIALCGYRLAQSGVLDLDAEIEQQPYSLRQLLNHSAGVPEYGQLAQYGCDVEARAPAWSRAKMIKNARPDDLLFKPGEGWAYSNIGYMFASEQIARAAGREIGVLIDEILCKPLGLASISMAKTQAQFAKIHWPQGAGYDPAWVFHGCLIGTAADAARLLHAVFAGQVVDLDTLAQMSDDIPLGGPIEGRPWTRCGYGAGLMIGEVGSVGRTLGHSGAGPFCVNAVYHFPDMETPLTVASFAAGCDEGVAEHEAVRLASCGVL